MVKLFDERAGRYATLPDVPMDDSTTSYEPKTALGKRLLALRKAYVNHGGKLLSPDELDAEIKARRGGVDDDDAPERLQD